jgi:hypothetical protein
MYGHGFFSPFFARFAFAAPVDFAAAFRFRKALTGAAPPFSCASSGEQMYDSISCSSRLSSRQSLFSFDLS